MTESPEVGTMSTRTADTLFGGATLPDPEIGELTGLVRRILSALGDAPQAAGMAFAAAGVVPVALEPEGMPTDFEFPMPEWGEMDFTVPAVEPPGVPW